MSDVRVRAAGPDDRAVLERLWLLFRHDLSEFTGGLPNPDGSFRDEWLRSGLTDPAWAAYLFRSGDHPAGFALVRGLDTGTRVLNSFFVVRGARRTGIGWAAVHDVIGRHPGAWEIAFQDANATAVRFWRRVAADVAGDSWCEERRPVPGKPDVPPDVWISFSTEEHAPAAG